MGSGRTDIVELGKATQFGSDDTRNDPKEARKKSKPWSVRNAVNRLCAQEMMRLEPGQKLTMEALGDQLFEGRTPKLGEMVALRRVWEAIRGNPKFSQFVTEDVDGKLVERVVETTVTLEQLVNGSFDESDQGSPE